MYGIWQNVIILIRNEVGQCLIEFELIFKSLKVIYLVSEVVTDVLINMCDDPTLVS